ncbi:hypothetical protein A2U01_0106851, partial [Trifolium medium]|nr:hypothetical protein [Trifolium medium]
MFVMRVRDCGGVVANG